MIIEYLNGNGIKKEFFKSPMKLDKVTDMGKGI